MAMSVRETAQALGGSTRYEVFCLVAEAGHPMTVGELARRLDVHPNVVRPHLSKLVRAGLLHEQVESRSERGRPRLLYTPVAGTVERWAEEPPYQQLAVLLAEVLLTGDDPRTVGRRSVRSLPSDTAAPVQAVMSELVRHGSNPRVTGQGEMTSVVLQGCPFPEAAATNPAVVCAIHMGLLEGLTDGLVGVQVASLEPEGPYQGACRLRLTVD